MKRCVVALALALAACAPRTIVVAAPSRTDVAVATGLKHTVFVEEMGCTAVDVGRGFVVTAKHCVDDEETQDDGLGRQYKAGLVVYVHKDLDFAILFDAGRLENKQPRLRAPRLGEHVYAIGYPVQVVTEKQALTVTDGIMCGPDDGEGHARFTAPIYYGNSGGGVWAEDGALIGISVSGVLAMPGMNFLVPADEIQTWLP